MLNGHAWISRATNRVFTNTQNCQYCFHCHCFAVSFFICTTLCRKCNLDAFSNSRAKTNLALLTFLYCGEFVKNCSIPVRQFGWRMIYVLKPWWIFHVLTCWQSIDCSFSTRCNTCFDYIMMVVSSYAIDAIAHQRWPWMHLPFLPSLLLFLDKKFCVSEVFVSLSLVISGSGSTEFN